MNLEEELNRLFADDRLDVPVAARAEEAVVAGARRVRRRRHVLAGAAGALALGLLAFGGIALGGLAAQPQQGPAGPGLTVTRSSPTLTTSTSPTATDSPSRQPQEAAPPSPMVVRTSTSENSKSAAPFATRTVPAGTVLGPTGFGPITLGMSKQAALATGLLMPSGGDKSCTAYQLSGGGRVIISNALGVARIAAPDGVRTPEGIRAGSTVADVKAAYPVPAAFRSTTYSVSVPGSPRASYEFVGTYSGSSFQDSDKITEIRLVLDSYDCSPGMN